MDGASWGVSLFLSTCSRLVHTRENINLILTNMKAFVSLYAENECSDERNEKLIEIRRQSRRERMSVDHNATGSGSFSASQTTLSSVSGCLDQG